MHIFGEHLHTKSPQINQIINNYDITKGLTIV